MPSADAPVQPPRRRFRARLRRQLEPRGLHGGPTPWLHVAIAVLILASVTVTVLETEPLIVAHAPHVFTAMNYVFGLIFTIEFAARFWVVGEEARFRGWRGRLRYLRQPHTLVDLFALLPFYLTFGGSDAFMLRLFRLLRLFQLARLGHFSVAMSHVLQALAARRFELLVSLVLAGLMLLVAATMLYLVEGRAQPEAFGSIPRALWWAVATLTTVGYGDVYPVTVPGRIFAGISAICAIGLIAMPAGILAAAFSDAFQQARERRQARANPDQRESPR